ncbi:MAG: hypothetical protein Q9220_001587 [cf. Caloplaca sp. 1 TL-2023]
MGKAGRFACIFTPMALTIASLICLVIVGLGGTNKNSDTYNNLYFFRANTTDINVDPSDLNIPHNALTDALLNQTTDVVKNAVGVKDFYHVSLWNYCSGDFDNGTDRVTFCSPRKNEFWFNPVEVWGLNNTGIDQIFSKELRNGLAAYKTTAKWMFIAYVVALVATIVEILVGFFALFSRWGSLATTIVSTISSLFVIGFALTATILYATLMGSFNDAVKKYNIHGSLGHSMYVVTWLAVAFSFGAGIFWLFSSCCCSGRSNRIKYGDNSGKNGTYERVESPYPRRNGPVDFQTGQGYQAPHHGVPLNPVIFAFVATSFITIAIAHTSLFLGIIRGYEDNEIDKWVSVQLQRVPFLHKNEKRTEFWQPIVESLVMALSDQQLLVGIAILITGFIEHCSISVYHFALASDLAWFSSNTHLTTLTVIHDYLIERKTLRNWRVMLMLAIFTMMMACTILEGHISWFDSWNCPAQCLFDDVRGNIGGEPQKSMIANIVLLVYGYTDAILGVTRSDQMDALLYERPVNKMKQTRSSIHKKRATMNTRASRMPRFRKLMLFVNEGVMILVIKLYQSAAAFLGSITIGLCFDYSWFAIGLWGIIEDRDIPADLIDGNENGWGFGQIVPVLLLSSILLTFKELYTGSASIRASERAEVDDLARNPRMPQESMGNKMWAILIETASGNVLWDLVALLDDSIIAFIKIKSRGGLKAMVISHPHFYTTYVEWAQVFDCPVYLSSEDKEWLCCKAPAKITTVFLGGTAKEAEILPGVTAITAGGHFPGSLVLHWNQRLFVADTIVTVPSAHTPPPRPARQTSYAFQWSIPNMIPLAPDDIMNIWQAIQPFDFHTTIGGFIDMTVRDQNVKARILESMKIQVRSQGWKEHRILDEQVT